MQEGTRIPSALVEQPFDCDFGGFVPRLTYRRDGGLRVQASIAGTEIDEVVAPEVIRLGSDLMLVSWVEANGNFVVQLQDHGNSVVHNVARLADGQVFRGEGAIRPA